MNARRFEPYSAYNSTVRTYLRAIAAFLDRETARIDALVAKKERPIELPTTGAGSRNGTMFYSSDARECHGQAEPSA